MMQEELNSLLDKLMNGELTEPEKQQLILLLGNAEHSEEFAVLINQQLESRSFALTGELPAMERKFIQDVLQKSGTNDIGKIAEIPPVHRVHFMRRWGWAAASVLLVLAAGLWFYNMQQRIAQPVAGIEKTNIAPGKEGAILTLADGSTLVLDSLGNGVVASQAGSEVLLNNGQLKYNTNSANNNTVAFNTMSTPRGRHFQVTLPDGTNVWLNAASSIRYPVAFAGDLRKVFVSGEAYFEVAKNEKMPFVVEVSNKETIQVLGTAFNVKAFDNEETINTTLISGSVRVASTILKPGQQAQLNTSAAQSADRLKLISNVDTDKVLAWKAGKFDFNGVKLPEAMKQLERWYDIEVVFENGVPDIELGGKITKDVDLNGLLNALKKSELQFRLEGKKLIIINN